MTRASPSHGIEPVGEFGKGLWVVCQHRPDSFPRTLNGIRETLIAGRWRRVLPTVSPGSEFRNDVLGTNQLERPSPIAKLPASCPIQTPFSVRRTPCDFRPWQVSLIAINLKMKLTILFAVRASLASSPWNPRPKSCATNSACVKILPLANEFCRLKSEQASRNGRRQNQ